MLAWIDYSTPQLYSAKSIILLIVFSCVAFLVSSLSPLERPAQDRFALFIPPAILVYWYLFQFQLMSLDPHVHYYLSPTGYFKWMTNSSICYAFSVAFSIRLLRVPTRGSRIEGVLFLLLFGFLIVFRDQMRPAMMTT